MWVYRRMYHSRFKRPVWSQNSIIRQKKKRIITPHISEFGKKGKRFTYKSWALERESIEQRQLIEHESEKRHDIPKDQINLTVKGVGKSELDPVYSEADHWSGRRPHVVWLERSEGVSSGRGLMRWGDGYRECWNCERRLAMSWLEPETRGERLTPWANEIISEERRWNH